MGSDVVTILDAAYRATGGDDDRLAAAIAGLSDVEGVDGAISYDWPGAGNTQLAPGADQVPARRRRDESLEERHARPVHLPAGDRLR